MSSRLSEGVLPSACSKGGRTSRRPAVCSGLEIRARDPLYPISSSTYEYSGGAWTGGLYKNYRREDNGDIHYLHAEWGLQITLYLT